MAGLETVSTSRDLGSKNSSIAMISFRRQDGIQIKCCLSIPAQKEGASTSPLMLGRTGKRTSTFSLLLDQLPPAHLSGRSHSSDQSEPRTFTGPCLPLGCTPVPWDQKSSSRLSDFQMATRSDSACFPGKGPAMTPLSSIFSICNQVGEPPASFISKTFDSSSLQYPSPCTSGEVKSEKSNANH